jgi:hypothetical protein
MSKLTFSINLDNDMFCEDAAPEISRIFQDFANFAKEATLTNEDLPFSKPLKDLNGNKIGYLKISK